MANRAYDATLYTPCHIDHPNKKNTIQYTFLSHLYPCEFWPATSSRAFYGPVVFSSRPPSPYPTARATFSSDWTGTRASPSPVPQTRSRGTSRATPVLGPRAPCRWLTSARTGFETSEEWSWSSCPCHTRMIPTLLGGSAWYCPGCGMD